VFAFFDQPLDDLAFDDGFRQLGHLEFYCHRFSSIGKTDLKIRCFI
jgi:hypothetical protein